MNDAEKFLAKLDKGDIERLTWLLAALRTIDGWCKVNRAIGKWIVFTALSLLILMSGAWDAIRNLFGIPR